ncbi:MAG: CARDB domain-containing protein [bacterium]|nr:CARDB domain-containing protein [bacterium]
MPPLFRWARTVLLAGIFFSILALFSPQSASAGGYSLKMDDIKKMNAQVINFENYNIDALTGYWDAYGVKFSSEKGKAIYVNSYHRGGATTASGDYSLANDATYPNTSVNDPLKITFKNGVDVVAFYLGNGKGSVKAYVKSYNQSGKIVHETDYDAIPNAVNTYVVLTYKEPIFSVTIDYGDTTYSEMIDELVWISTGAKVTCQDQDGLNYDFYGSILGRDENSSAPFSYFDQCANSIGDDSSLEQGPYVMEYICSGTADKPYAHKLWYKCANGCSLGACKPSPTAPVVAATCSDSDNGVNNSVFGFALGNDELTGAKGNYSDSCGAYIGDQGKNVGAYVAEKHCSGTSLKPYVHTQWYKCDNGCSDGKCIAKVDINAQCNATCQQRSGTEGICGGSEGEMIGTKYCALQSQCVCKPTTCTTDTQCEATSGANFKCISGKCVYPDCDTACKVNYGYSGGSCDAVSGKEVGSAFCGQTYKQCRCIVDKPVTQKCYDSDGGLIYNVFGYSYGSDEITIKLDNYFDSCGASIGDQGKASGDYLVEKNCSGSTDKPYVHSQWYKCENGCQNGACKTAVKPSAEIDVGLYGFVKIGKYEKQVKWGETITLTPEDAVTVNGKQTSVFSLFYSSKNYGDKDSGAFKNGIYVNGGLVTTPSNSSLSENDIQNFDFLVNLKEKNGTHAIKISIDSNNSVVESSESNNSGTVYVKLVGFDDQEYDLNIKPIITKPYSNEVLTNYPRRATIAWTAIKNAKSYEVEVTCDLCGASDWVSKYYYKSRSNSLLTPALPGDNQFRVIVRAILKDGTKSTWSDFVYFRYKTTPTKKTTCQSQSGSDGVYTLCVGKSLTHNTGLKIMVSKQNNNYVWLKVTWNNSTYSKIYKIKKGNTKSFDEPNSNLMVDITYLKYGGSRGAVLRLETDNTTDDDLDMVLQ